jgi:hypothetical protein
MNPSASPRHPWKALAVVLAMFVVVHGVRAHVGTHGHGFTHVQVIHAAPWGVDCPDIDSDDVDDVDEPDVTTFIDMDDCDVDWT